MPCLSRPRPAPVLLGLLLAAACNKGPARDALDEADQAIAAAAPDLEAYVPQELAALRAELARGRAQLAAGHYTEALRAGQDLPGPIRDAIGRAALRKAELSAEWSRLAGVVPLELRGLAARLDLLPPPSAAPQRGLEPAALVDPRAELRELSAGWSRAEAALASGRVVQALASGRGLQQRTDALAARLGLSPAAAAAAASIPPATRSPSAPRPPAPPPATPPPTEPPPTEPPP